MKLPYLLAKNSQDVLNVHKVEFLKMKKIEMKFENEENLTV